MGTKQEQEKNKVGRKSEMSRNKNPKVRAREEQSGNKWDQEPQSGNKRGTKWGTKWDQESQSGNKRGTKWEQSGLKNPKMGTREEQSGNKVGPRIPQ